MTLSYEELAPILYRVARKYANHRYSIHELINEVWLMGYIQKLPNIKLAYNRARYDMIHYMRSQEGRRSKHKSKHKIRTPIVETSVRHSFSCNDFKHDLKYLLSKFSQEEKLVVYLRLTDFTNAEIAKIIGEVNETRISQIFSKTIRRLKNEFNRTIR